ncbi:hypothetical protein PROFUN_02615 [Planoprotostelium fungivorum]|uniref:Uncharacterized protein n=1 Tax=Planoprotostelium fungivorum TaxID=1890364 RepID=A0A2P6NVK1_9EUKA|nr:hypothetical protein PROFUN_02615 [Planoprotostelium fungivorum]
MSMIRSFFSGKKDEDAQARLLRSQSLSFLNRKRESGIGLPSRTSVVEESEEPVLNENIGLPGMDEFVRRKTDPRPMLPDIPSIADALAASKEVQESPRIESPHGSILRLSSGSSRKRGSSSHNTKGHTLLLRCYEEIKNAGPLVHGEINSESLLCPYCDKLMEDPVVLPVCGHSSCRDCLLNAMTDPAEWGDSKRVASRSSSSSSGYWLGRKVRQKGKRATGLLPIDNVTTAPDPLLTQKEESIDAIGEKGLDIPSRGRADSATPTPSPSASFDNSTSKSILDRFRDRAPTRTRDCACKVCGLPWGDSVTVENIDQLLSTTLAEAVGSQEVECRFNQQLWKNLMLEQSQQNPAALMAALTDGKESNNPTTSDTALMNSPRLKESDFCREVILLSELSSHEMDCPYAPEMCKTRDTERRDEFCHKIVPRCQIEQHRQKECPYRAVRCTNENCRRSVSFHHIEEHLENCDFKMVVCPNGCGRMIASISLENHIHQECVIACDWDMFQHHLQQNPDALGTKEFAEVLVKKIKYQNDKMCNMIGEIQKYERRKDPDDELDGSFNGPYYPLLMESKYRNLDQDFILKFHAQGGRDNRPHLIHIFGLDSHPIGKSFVEMCDQVNPDISQKSHGKSQVSSMSTNRTKQIQSSIANRSSKTDQQAHLSSSLSSISLTIEDVSIIAHVLWSKTGTVCRSMVTTWPIYRDREHMRDLVYNLAIDRIYNDLINMYRIKYSYEDKAFSNKCKDMTGVTPAYLGIARELCLVIEDNTPINSRSSSEKDTHSSVQYIFSMGAISLLKNLPDFTTVTEKMDCLVATVQMICNSVKNYMSSTGLSKEYSTKEVVVAADDLLPMLCYVALHCHLSCLYSELKFINDFCAVDDKLLSGQEGYCISMLEGAMEHIMTMAPPPMESMERTIRNRPRAPSVDGFMKDMIVTEDVQEEFERACDMSSDDKEMLLSRWSCNLNSLTRKGMLYVTMNALYYVPNSRKELKFKVLWTNVYTVRKAKFAIVDNALEVLIKQPAIDDKEPNFIVHKFNGLDNRNSAFSHLFRAHQTAQLSSASPTSDIMIYDESIDCFDPLSDVDFGKMREGYLNEKFTVRTAEDAALFAALLAHITYGDYNPRNQRENFFKSNRKLVPTAWKDEIEEKFAFQQWQNMSGLSDTICKLYFIQRGREIARKMMLAYGLHIFFVSQCIQTDGKKFSPVILGITTEAILIMPSDTLEVTRELPIRSVQSYSFLNHIFSVDFGGDTILHFSTNQGDIIVGIIEEMLETETPTEGEEEEP